MGSPKRFVYLNLLHFNFPLTAIISILHRISGTLLFILTPAVVWLWGISLSDGEAGFEQALYFLEYPLVRCGLWIFLSALSFHLIAGIKHLILDLGYGEQFNQAKIASYLSLILFLVITILIALWLV